MLKSPFLRRFLVSIWFPVVWLTIVVVHIILFSAEPPQGVAIQIFDKAVMLSCFLLYPIHAFGGAEMNSSFLPFALQFLFWWLVSFGIHAIYDRTRARAR